MVNKVNPPEEDSVEIANRTIEERSRYREFYKKLKKDLLCSIARYEACQGDPEKLLPMDLRNYTSSDEEAADRKASLIALYSPKRGKLPYLQLETLRKFNGLVVCPSCGEPGRPRTLDHYLPKDIYPEYSFTLINLTPMCDWCQGEKLVKFSTQNGQKRFIHPYFDDVGRPLFFLTFSPPYDTPIVGIGIYQGIEPGLSALISSHLDGINFLERYRGYLKTRYTSILRKAHECRTLKRISLKDWLGICLESEIEKSINSWDAILYRSILECKDLMDFLETGSLPDNL